jgi:hypothetical protein
LASITGILVVLWWINCWYRLGGGVKKSVPQGVLCRKWCLGVSMTSIRFGSMPIV